MYSLLISNYQTLPASAAFLKLFLRLNLLICLTQYRSAIGMHPGAQILNVISRASTYMLPRCFIPGTSPPCLVPQISKFFWIRKLFTTDALCVIRNEAEAEIGQIRPRECFIEVRLEYRGDVSGRSAAALIFVRCLWKILAG